MPVISLFQNSIVMAVFSRGDVPLAFIFRTFGAAQIEL
jgi:hypothetical protein